MVNGDRYALYNMDAFPNPDALVMRIKMGELDELSTSKRIIVFHSRSNTNANQF